MEGAGDQFLAGAALAGDQDGNGVGLLQHLDVLQHLLQSVARRAGALLDLYPIEHLARCPLYALMRP